MKSLVKCPVKKRTNGYTLLEMSIVMIVVGIVMASAASAYNIYLKNKAQVDTASNINTVMSAVSNYFIQNGKYPCPARLDLPRTDPNYGMPTACTTDPAILAMNPGDYLNGLYMEERDSTIPILVPPKPVVLRGAVPFRVLNQPEYVTEDGYHTRLEYVVTQILTDPATYHKDHGGISVIDEQNRSVVKDPDSIHFIVLSHGPDKEGAWSNNGASILPCGSGMDAENCNTSTPNKQAVYRTAQTSSVSGANHFDDFVKYFSAVETPFWTVADAAGTNIRDAGLAQQLAIGKPTSVYEGTVPATPTSLDVVTHIRADNNLKIGQWCDAANPADCFTPDLIAGNDPAMDCAGNPLGGYVRGVGSKKVSCTTAKSACSSGVLLGVDASGNLLCGASPVSCSATNVAVCSTLPTTDYTIPPGAVGDIHITPVNAIPSNDSRQRKFVCSASGTWVNGSPWAWGVCGCTPSGPTPITQTCQSYKGSTLTNGCWDGNVTYTTQTTCGPKTTIISGLDTSDCKCKNCNVPTTGVCTALPVPVGSLTNPTAPGADTPSLPTVAGWVGTPTYTKNWECSSTTAGSFINWTYTGQSPQCSCGASIQTETNKSCAITGCDATGVWAANGQYPCLPGFVGAGKYVNRERTYDCVTGTWPSTWTNTDNTCHCTAVIDTQTVACPTGYSGNIEQINTFNCSTNNWDGWVNKFSGSPPASCTPLRWKPVGAKTGSGTGLIGEEVYTACGPVNATSSCSSPTASGYDYYHCECK